MSVIKDIVKKYDITSGVPQMFGGGSSATFESYKGSGIPERISDGSEHPTEEPVQQAVLDGRQVQASNELAFTQMIMELSEDSTPVIDILQTAAEENNNVWIRREGLAENADQEIIGGKMGLTVSVGRVRQGSDGHRMIQALFEGASAHPGGIIQPYTNTST